MLIIIPLHLAILISLQYTNCLTDYNIQHISKLKPRHTTWPNDIAESKLCHTTSWMRQKEGALATGLWWSPPLNLFTLKPISSTLLWAQHSMPIIQFLLFLSELWRYMNKRKAHCNHASTVHCTHRKQVRERGKNRAGVMLKTQAAHLSGECLIERLDFSFQTHWVSILISWLIV